MVKPIWFLRALSVITVSLCLSLPHLFAETTGAGEVHYAISAAELKNSLAEVQELISQGELLEAKSRYQTLLQYDLGVEDRNSVRQSLEDLNLKILFSPILTPDSLHYTVMEGDSLYKIAERHHTTIDLIKKSNHLQGDLIRPGMELKVSKAVYSILIRKSENKLILYSDEEPLKTYPVATGEGVRTPIGTFTIESKLENPVWFRAGAVLPAGSPENILGTRWLGFSLAGYGIHGTTDPDTIGQHVTQGCVRMRNEAVEELYSIVPLKTKATIVEA